MHIKCDLVGKHTISTRGTPERAFGVRQSDHTQRGLCTDLGGEMARHLMRVGQLGLAFAMALTRAILLAMAQPTIANAVCLLWPYLGGAERRGE